MTLSPALGQLELKHWRQRVFVQSNWEMVHETTNLKLKDRSSSPKSANDGEER